MKFQPNYSVGYLKCRLQRLVDNCMAHARWVYKPNAIHYNDLPQETYAGILASLGIPEGFATVIADAEAGVPQGWLSDESGALSRLIGRPTTSLDDAVTTALKG